MNFKVYLRPEAEEDAEEAAIWYEKQRKGLGSEFIDELQKIINKVHNHPEMYPIVYKQVHRAVLSRFPFGLFYLAEEDTVIVLAVMHGSRHPKKWKKRM